MGLDKLFSSRLAVHAVFDPSFTTFNQTKRELILFDSTWLCDAVEVDVQIVRKLFWITAEINKQLWG